MPNNFVLFICFWLCGYFSYGQQQISGVLLDNTSKKGIRAASVNLKSSDGKVISFKITDALGHFEMITSKDLTNAHIEINHIGYKRFSQALGSQLRGLQIILEQTNILLEEVKVKSAPKIARRGDTLNYNVAGFADPNDRTIGDVLKRMPGLEVLENGEVKYQGKSVSNFYIDGDDLLAGKYGLGTKSISPDIVKDIQVISHHEHIKLLKNKRYSDDVALNLVIKEEAKLMLSGKIMLGMGIPKHFDGELNTMMFNKKVKFLNVLKANNIGQDLATYMEETRSQAKIDNLLSLGTIGNPPLEKRDYLKNKTGLFDFNFSKPIKRDWSLRTNIQGLYDRNNIHYEGKNTYYTEKGDISFHEIQISKIKTKAAIGQVTVESNTDHFYFKNSLTMGLNNEDSESSISSDTRPIDNNIQHRSKTINNQLIYVPELKNGNIIQVQWFSKYYTKPQRLSSSTEVFNDLFYPVIFDKIIQHVNVPTFNTVASLGYRIPTGKINQYYSINLGVESQRLESNIKLLQGEKILDPLLDSTINRMNWLRTSSEFSAHYTWNKERFNSNLSLPIAFIHTRFEDKNYQLNNWKNLIQFTPSFSARYHIGYDDELAFSYKNSNNLGNIDAVYRGLIIQNYRTRSYNSSANPVTRNNDFLLNYKLGQSAKLLFFHFGLGYGLKSTNNMIATTVTDSLTATQLIAKENSIHSYTATIGFDKYLFKLGTLLKLKFNWRRSNYNQLFNNEILPFAITSYELQPAFNKKFLRRIELDYNSSINLSFSSQGNTSSDRRILFITQSMNFPINIAKSVLLKWNLQHLFNKQPDYKNTNYLFCNIMTRYSRWGMDFELDIRNIANIKRFETNAITANIQSQNRYELNGRTALIRGIYYIK
ncbi:hypothetical protein BCY89_13795 [Sphingobacterium siyangense]|uniref:Uncharacterized protein n=1 Tax=Sphingobacterium siyangense TaxID=459529 RepID=A0A420FH63_9SPHI|nr:hypothetical protein [Sphingobacterium siyangense]RKF32269.1 hypothetical protein BCY89_13795 [Sphingobacterium siyangense]